MPKHKKRPIRETAQVHKPVEKPGQRITSVPARIIEQGRSTSHHIIDTLARTALSISNSENAADRLNVIQTLWNMQKEAEDRQAEREFNTAKVMVATNLPTIPKTGKREFMDKNNVLQSSTYSTLDDIEGVLDKICRDYGVVKEYSSKSNDKGWACQVLTVRHVSGHKEVYESPYMPLDTSGSKNNQQGAGSVAKYGRRYALIGAFNIFHVDEDTDGSSSNQPEKEDKFSTRASAEAARPASGSAQQPLSLPEAAEALERKLRNMPVEKRPDCLMKHISIIAAMEELEGMAPKAAELRKLCDGEPQ